MKLGEFVHQIPNFMQDGYTCKLRDDGRMSDRLVTKYTHTCIDKNDKDPCDFG